MNELAPPTNLSPCTGVCKLDQQTGWCLGCGRTGDEIGRWRNETTAWRQAVWEDIPTRLNTLGIMARRLPWSTDDIRDYVLDTLKEGSGRWILGVEGAQAMFGPAADHLLSLENTGNSITAITANGALRFLIDDDLRAVSFDPPQTPAADLRVVLAVKRERRVLDLASVLTDLGADNDAVRPDAAQRLFDLGLGRREARFCVRCPEGEVSKALDGMVGLRPADALRRIGPLLMSQSPTRVVETRLGRIEIDAAIPKAGAKASGGIWSHLSLDQLASRRALPVGMDLPAAYLPGAVFYPYLQ